MLRVPWLRNRLRNLSAAALPKALEEENACIFDEIWFLSP